MLAIGGRTLFDSVSHEAYPPSLTPSRSRFLFHLPSISYPGAGTGLLSVFAAKAGAAKVYAVEQHRGLAAVLRNVAINNGVEETITVIPKRSRDVTLADLDSAPANLVISELLDFSLLGEGMLPTLTDARRLLTPDAAAVPVAGRLYGQLVESSHAGRMRLKLDGDDGELVCGPGRVCSIRAEGLQSTRFEMVSQPFQIRSLDLTPQCIAEEVKPWHSTIQVAIRLTGEADAVLLWWELDVLPPISSSSAAVRDTALPPSVNVLEPWTSPQYDPDRTISTHPGQIKAVGFQDHWPQGLWVFDRTQPVVVDTTVLLQAYCPDGINVRFGELLVGKAAEASAAPPSENRLTPLLAAVAPDHSLHYRLFALNDPFNRGAFMATSLSLDLPENAHVLDLCPGGRCALALAAASEPTLARITSYQPLATSRGLLITQLKLLGSPTSVTIWASAPEGQPWDASWPQVDVVVGEFWNPSMAARPLWAALDFCHLCNELQSVLKPDVKVFPSGLQLCAALISAPDLAASHAPVVCAVEGVDQTPFDDAQKSSASSDMWLTLAEYECEPVTKPVELMRINFYDELRRTDAIPVFNAVDLVGAPTREDAKADALAVWVEPLADATSDSVAVEWKPSLDKRYLVRWCGQVFGGGIPVAAGDTLQLKAELAVSSGDLSMRLEYSGGTVALVPTVYPPSMRED